jgi:hypothetical protein
MSDGNSSATLSLRVLAWLRSQGPRALLATVCLLTRFFATASLRCSISVPSSEDRDLGLLYSNAWLLFVARTSFLHPLTFLIRRCNPFSPGNTLFRAALFTTWMTATQRSSISSSCAPNRKRCREQACAFSRGCGIGVARRRSTLTVNENETTQTLRPNLTRAFFRVLFVCLALVPIAAVADRYRLGHWWSPGYVASLIIPLLVMPTAVCLMLVPRRIQWSAIEFTVEPRFGRPQTLPWTQLYAYGSGNNVFLIQFTGVSTFQIFAGAFSRDEWRAFRSFLATNYPDKKASFWLGPKAIRWNRNA